MHTSVPGAACARGAKQNHRERGPVRPRARSRSEPGWTRAGPGLDPGWTRAPLGLSGVQRHGRVTPRSTLVPPRRRPLPPPSE
ncbi:hypothetical protein SKAU_G00201400 [Synaphobranchus kaupii]|uniref:Uncharacterized protein n=1 Tax=Synaphobranchus kaupii TaxID=118154 RepID=A0A9Q1FFG6_SYNKA|nr:hypothetical protein SKAU_G00201400 [Synaphobranchus kaupii]